MTSMWTMSYIPPKLENIKDASCSQDCAEKRCGPCRSEGGYSLSLVWMITKKKLVQESSLRVWALVINPTESKH